MIDGHLMVNAGGLRLEEETLPRALNILYQLMVQHKDEKEVAKIDRQLKLDAVDSWRRGNEAPVTDPTAPVSRKQVQKQEQLMAMLGQFGQM